ncbi:GNAT family N-acetyltransferase [Yinghuangia soli]|uniref:GNAT family N-acetyltransferase n=1 Tax=Yinghuangia soli TaxID=2908204 RepID=A0AA41Q221_9ACTN|nr:GNAT family N-acetyltransferase [Yinghuangia soli]MCF2529762.1 GNAT family N-acetyltransferase [Yinghuangia soli]
MNARLPDARGELLRAQDLDAGFGTAWDALAAGRGVLADCFDTHAWASGVLRHNPAAADRARIAAVLDPATGAPHSILALEELAPGRFATFAADRPRSRVVSDADDLTPLAEQLARAGVRDLRLHRMPSRDPATHRLLGALRRTGYRVHARERSCDMLADARDGWAGHRSRFKSFHTHCGRVSRKAAKQADITFEVQTEPDRIGDGFEVYADLFPRSWKGPLNPQTRAERRDLVQRAAENGWVRLYILRVDGRPAATYLWFRVGGVALWHSTAYDEEFAALGVGNIAMWQAHEHILTEDADDPPALVDLLPTSTEQKLRLAPERPPLLDIEAVRERPFAAAVLPVRALARTAKAGATARLKARARRTAPVPATAPQATAQATAQATPEAAPEAAPQPHGPQASPGGTTA